MANIDSNIDSTADWICNIHRLLKGQHEEKMKQQAEDRTLLTHKMDDLIRVLKDTAQTQESYRLSSQEDQVEYKRMLSQLSVAGTAIAASLCTNADTLRLVPTPAEQAQTPSYSVLTTLLTPSVIASSTATSVLQGGPDDTSTSHAKEVRGNGEDEAHLHEGYGQGLMDPPVGRGGDGPWAPP